MPASQRTQLFQTLSVLLLIVISLLFAYEGWLPRPWSWLVVFGALLVFWSPFQLLVKLPLRMVLQPCFAADGQGRKSVID